MEKSNEKKVLIFSTIAVVLLIVVVVGATYAFFTAQGGASANTNVNVQTNTTDSLSFSVGDAISITANQQNFAQGAGNQAGSTTASATLTANNATNTATRNYYLYLNITSNDFTYTTDEETAELILTIEDPDGTELQTLGSYEYTTVEEVSGFDITTANGLITIADNYEISATETPTTQTWNVTVTFVNLDSDQEENTNKTFEATLVIREDSPIGITEVNTSNITTDSITLTVNAESENTITNYYFAKNEEEYVSSASNTYTFTGLDAGTAYTLKVYAVDDEGYKSAVYSTEVTTSSQTLAELCSGKNFAECITTQVYIEDGVNGLYCHDGTGSYINADQEAGDNSYRFSGANPDNYICFGSDVVPCPSDNLYRIIGVFEGQIKVIKSDYATSTLLGTDGEYFGKYNLGGWFDSVNNGNNASGYYANSANVNTWSESALNTVNLNRNFLDNIGSTWSSKIANHTWQVGGISFSNGYSSPVKTAFNYEIGANSTNTIYNAKIGLMYVSDYGYASSPDNWSVNLGNLLTDENRNNNWLFMGCQEWTITRDSDNTLACFYVNTPGNITSLNVRTQNAVRPSFYLNPNVTLLSGDGTSSNPYRIS